LTQTAALIANDIAPSLAFTKLEPVLRERGYDVALVVNDGKPVKRSEQEIVRAVSGATVVVLGMSSAEALAGIEILAGREAKEAGIPYGFYSDIPRCWARARPGAWFEDLAEGASFYFGVNDEDAEGARDVLPHAILTATGNPLREEMAFPSLSRQESRNKLGIVDNEKMILASGGKFAAGNMAQWSLIMDALALLDETTDLHLHLILAPHPGDRTPHAIDRDSGEEMKLYEKLVSFSPVTTRIVNKDLLTTSNMVPGADIICEHGSSIGIEGAYQGIPVISIGNEILIRRMFAVTGTRELEAVQNGISTFVGTNAEELANQISRLLTPEGFEPMRKRQLACCPKPTERGAALKKMADAIEKIVSR